MGSPDLDDSELLRRARTDASAFGVFYRRHARAVYRSLLLDCGNPDVALDLDGRDVRPGTQVDRALSRSARRVGACLDLRHRQLAAAAIRREWRIEDRARRRLGILEAARLHDDDDSVVARVDAEASRERLADVMQALPESQQSVLRLRIENEATYEEIALRLGCSPAAARQQASRGMRRLSEQFQAAVE